MKKWAFCLSTCLLTHSVCADNKDNDVKALQAKVDELNKVIEHLQDQQHESNKTMAERLSESVSKDIHWVHYENHIPSKELVNANINDSKTPINVCQAAYTELGVHPGQLALHTCVITYAGKQLIMKHYNALTSTKPIHWRPSADLLAFADVGACTPKQTKMAILPTNSLQAPNQLPIIGGIEKGKPLYICRGIYNNTLHIGKVVTNKCYIAADSKEVEIRDFEVMFN